MAKSKHPIKLNFQLQNWFQRLTVQHVGSHLAILGLDYLDFKPWICVWGANCFDVIKNLGWISHSQSQSLVRLHYKMWIDYYGKIQGDSLRLLYHLLLAFRVKNKRIMRYQRTKHDKQNYRAEINWRTRETSKGKFSLSRHIERYRHIDWSVPFPGLAPCNYLSLAVMLHGSDVEIIMRAHTSLVIPFYLHTRNPGQS